MNQVYGRDLDLNLLRVFVVTAEAGGVTAAAGRLYLTQPAVSAALKRLAEAVGAPLFVRAGRGLALTARGKALLLAARPHLEALVGAALSPATPEPRSSARTVRIGMSDTNEAWLLPPLLRALAQEAPGMRLVIVPVQFRTIGEALASGAVDLAISVADELPPDIRRRTLFVGGFVCLYDPRHARLPRKLTVERYLAHEHVIVSYNADLRGIVEDLVGLTRRVRLSVSTFHGLEALVDGTGLLATVPDFFARQARASRPHLRTAALPFVLGGAPMELLWRTAVDDDAVIRFVRELVERIALVARARR
ncbi:MAG TPA: LysR family transcriptional regulator [Labilithrix sp.]|nr:LysR family transcriptional regulator [Labilithrix sp.]